jgi:DNA-binding MarR family transcriptional regulator
MNETAQPGSELAVQLERTFRLLGKRIYRPSFRRASTDRPGLDNSGVLLLAALEGQVELRPSDIAAALELDQSTVSRQLRQLEDLGLVLRRPDDVDGRVSRMSLTASGRESLALVRTARAAMLDEVFDDWPEDERRHLLILLDRLLAGLAALPHNTTNRESRR